MIALPTFRNSYYKKQRDVLQLFQLEGEGGYESKNFTFTYNSSAFFTTNVGLSVTAIVADDTRVKTLTVGSTTYNYMDNVLRIVLGNNNKCVIFRDGYVDINNSTSFFPYLTSVMSNIRDTFTPSSYATGNTQFKQLLLLKNGDLVEIDCYNKTNTTLLTGVQTFLTKNQAHKADAIVGMNNGDVYHVWVGPTPVNDLGNGTATGSIKINGLNHNNLLFVCTSDIPANSVFCYKNDRKNLYKFTNGNRSNFKITGYSTTPIASMALTGNEYYIDGISNEFNNITLTNKRFRVRSGALMDSIGTVALFDSQDWTYSKDYDLIDSKSLLNPTSYSVIVEDVNGNYYAAFESRSSSAYTVSRPEAYTQFDDLRQYLTAIKNAS